MIRSRVEKYNVIFIEKQRKSSGKINKYEYLKGEEIFPSIQNQTIEHAKFTYSLLGKAFEKQTKTIKDQGEKQTKVIQNQGQSKKLKNILIMTIDFKTKRNI